MGPIALREDQYDAVQKMRDGNILCGGVGSGKTITSLAYYYKEMGGQFELEKVYDPIKECETTIAHMPPNMKGPKDLYIITTAKKRDSHDWDQELLTLYMSQDPKCTLYQNTIVKVDSWNNIDKYIGVKNAFFIFDEQRVVGSGAWVKSFLKITKSNRWLLLSATPGDCWMDYIPVFVANGFYRNRTEFIHEHVVYNWHVDFPQVDRYIGTKKLERLRDMILVNIEFNRFTVRHHETVMCEYDRDKYKYVCVERKNPWETFKVRDRVFEKPIANASEFCSILRKIVNSDPSRAKAVLDIVKGRNKVIIFYNFNFELEILRSLDYGEDYVVAEWNGAKHEEIPKSGKWIYLVQYNAGAEGWNCIETNNMIFYSDNYSYRVMEQAAGRIDRANTSFTDLHYWHLRSTSKIDLAINRALIQKKKFNVSSFCKRQTFGQGLEAA